MIRTQVEGSQPVLRSTFDALLLSIPYLEERYYRPHDDGNFQQAIARPNIDPFRSIFLACMHQRIFVEILLNLLPTR